MRALSSLHNIALGASGLTVTAQGGGGGRGGGEEPRSDASSQVESEVSDDKRRKTGDG
jgi:hypothetical protein